MLRHVICSHPLFIPLVLSIYNIEMAASLLPLTESNSSFQIGEGWSGGGFRLYMDHFEGFEEMVMGSFKWLELLVLIRSAFSSPSFIDVNYWLWWFMYGGLSTWLICWAELYLLACCRAHYQLYKHNYNKFIYLLFRRCLLMASFSYYILSLLAFCS